MDDVTNYVPFVHVPHAQDRVPAHKHVFHKLYLVGNTDAEHCVANEDGKHCAEQYFFSTIKIVTEVLVTIFSSFTTNCLSITI